MSIPDEKLLWFKFFPTDWLGDSHLQATSAATRGIWSNLISHMKRRGVGELVATLATIARMGGASVDEAALFLAEMDAEKAADVFQLAADGSREPIDCHAFVTPEVARKYVVVSRRLSRETRKRKADANRQRAARDEDRHAESRPDVAEVSRDSESSYTHARDQRSEIREERDIKQAHAHVGAEPISATLKALCVAWPNAGLWGMPGATIPMRVIADEIDKLGMSPENFCKACRRIVDGYTKNGYPPAQTPEKMLGYLRAGTISGVLDGTIKPGESPPQRSNGRPPEAPRPRDKRLEDIEREQAAAREKNRAERLSERLARGES